MFEINAVLREANAKLSYIDQGEEGHSDTIEGVNLYLLIKRPAKWGFNYLEIYVTHGIKSLFGDGEINVNFYRKDTLIVKLEGDRVFIRVENVLAVWEISGVIEMPQRFVDMINLFAKPLE